MKPGRKSGRPKAKRLTETEQHLLAEKIADERRRWAELFGINVNAWISTPAQVAKHSRKVKGGRP